jgi:hypothetical protein
MQNGQARSAHLPGAALLRNAPLPVKAGGCFLIFRVISLILPLRVEMAMP